MWSSKLIDESHQVLALGSPVLLGAAQMGSEPHHILCQSSPLRLGQGAHLLQSEGRRIRVLTEIHAASRQSPVSDQRVIRKIPESRVLCEPLIPVKHQMLKVWWLCDPLFTRQDCAQFGGTGRKQCRKTARHVAGCLKLVHRPVCDWRPLNRLGHIKSCLHRSRLCRSRDVQWNKRARHFCMHAIIARTDIRRWWRRLVCHDTLVNVWHLNRRHVNKVVLGQQQQIFVIYVYVTIELVVLFEPQQGPMHNASADTEVVMRVLLQLLTKHNNVRVSDTSRQRANERRQILRQVDHIATVPVLTASRQPNDGHHRYNLCDQKLFDLSQAFQLIWHGTGVHVVLC